MFRCIDCRDYRLIASMRFGVFFARVDQQRLGNETIKTRTEWTNGGRDGEGWGVIPGSGVRFERRKVDRFERRKVDRFERRTVLLEDVVPTYQEGLQGYFKKMLQRIRNVLQVTPRRFRTYQESGTSCKLLGEDVTTYQERLTSDLTQISERIRNILQVTWRRCTTYQERLTSDLTKMLTMYQEHLARY